MPGPNTRLLLMDRKMHPPELRDAASADIKPVSSAKGVCGLVVDSNEPSNILAVASENPR